MLKVLKVFPCLNNANHHGTVLLSYKFSPLCIRICTKKHDCKKQKPPKPQLVEKLGRMYFPHMKIFTPERVSSFVKSLSDSEKQQITTELRKHQSLSPNKENVIKDGATISTSQLKWLFLYNCVPFIGFGFLDNAIMIMAGEYIDLTIGVTLGISTMAAAALGNLISDLAGLGLAGYVEILCGRMGLPIPDLSPQQMEHGSSRFSSNLGKVVGVAIGCIIGMFPLLFLNEKNEDTEG